MTYNPGHAQERGTGLKDEHRAVLELYSNMNDIEDIHDLPDMLFDVLREHVYFDWMALYIDDILENRFHVIQNSNLPFDWNLLYPEISNIDSLRSDALAGSLREPVLSQERFELDTMINEYVFEFTNKKTDTVYCMLMQMARKGNILLSAGLYRTDRLNPYTAADWAMFELLGPVIADCLRCMFFSTQGHIQRVTLDAMVDCSGKYYLLLDEKLRIQYIPDETRFFIEEVFPARAGRSDFLPQPLFGRIINSLSPAPKRSKIHFSTKVIVPGSVIAVEIFSLEKESPPMLLMSLEKNSKDNDFSTLESAGLSSREIECLEYLPSGLTNSQIATLMKISESTVKKHLHNIGSKLHAYNKTEIIYQAMRMKKNIVTDNQSL